MKGWAFDVAALVLFVLLGAGGLWAAGEIKGMSFDPLGSAAAPYAIGAGVILLSLLCGVSLIRRARRSASEEQVDERRYSAGEILEVLAMIALVVFYIIALFQLRLPFSLTTLVFIPAVACLLERSVTPRGIAVALIAGFLIGVGGELLFTKVFFVDLPTLW